MRNAEQSGNAQQQQQAQQQALNAVQQANRLLNQNQHGNGNPQNLQQGVAQAQQNLQQLRDQQNQAARTDQATASRAPQCPAAGPAARRSSRETLSENTRALQQQLQSLANNNRQQNPNAANQLRAAANQLSTQPDGGSLGSCGSGVCG